VKRATRNLWLSIALVGVLVVASGVAFVTGTRPVLGLDLEGGVSVILSAPPGTDHATMEQALENIRRRVDAFGVGEPLLYLSGTNIEVQLPGLARGTVQPRRTDQYRLVGPLLSSSGQVTTQDYPWASYTSKADADKALSGLQVAPGSQQFCLTGDLFAKGSTPACVSTKKDAQQALKGLTVVPASQASPPPSGTTTKGSYCVNGTGQATAPCYDSKHAAQQAVDGVSIQTTTLDWCVAGADGTAVSEQACFADQSAQQSTTGKAVQGQALAQTLLSAIQKAGVVHQTTQYCVISSAGKNLGCFLTQDQASAQMQQFGQERLLQVIGTTARLEERQVMAVLSSTDPNYASTPITCGTQAQASTKSCSFDVLKDKTVWFQSSSGLKYQLGPVEVTGDMIKKATAVYSAGGTNGGPVGWQIDFTLTSSGSKKFADVTSRLVSLPAPSSQPSPSGSNELAIVVDNKVISAPTVQGAITGGNGQISGSFTKASAQDLATQLNAGALPVNLKKQQVQTVSPTLGKQSLHQGLVAGIVGLVLLAIYLLFYYRLLGLVAWAGMSIWAVLAVALVSVAGRTVGYSLTLAGIAGLVISLGVTADSYIVFFERLKDEVRHGKTPRAAVQPAFKRAYKTIVAADLITAIAAIVLYLTAISSVRGFALTLGVATLLDLFVVYFFKRPTVFLIARNERLVNLHGFGLTSGVAAEPVRGEVRPAIAGGAK